MQNILCESAGWVLFSDGQRLVFADRGTSYLTVLVFVLALITVIAGGNGIVWLVAGIRSGEASRLGFVLLVVAGLAGLGAWKIRAADKQRQTEIPAQSTWVAVIDLESRVLATPAGEALAPMTNVRFAPVMQLASSSRALAAQWPEGSLVVYRGSPFAGSYKAALEVLRDHGLEAQDP